MRNYNVSKFIYIRNTHTQHILCITHNTTATIHFVDFCYFNIHSFCGSEYLAFLCYDMIVTHIFMGISRADAKHNITGFQLDTVCVGI